MQNKEKRNNIIIVVVLLIIIAGMSFIFAKCVTNFAKISYAKTIRRLSRGDFDASYMSMPCALKEGADFEDIEKRLGEDSAVYFADSAVNAEVDYGRRVFNSCAIIKTESWKDRKIYQLIEGEDILSDESEDKLPILVGGHLFGKARLGEEIKLSIDGISYLCKVKGKVENVNYYSKEMYIGERSIIIIPDKTTEVSKDKFMIYSTSAQIAGIKDYITNDLHIYRQDTTYVTHDNKKEYGLIYMALASIFCVALIRIFAKRAVAMLITSLILGIVVIFSSVFILISANDILYYLQHYMWQFTFLSAIIWTGANGILIVLEAVYEKKSQKAKEGTDSYDKLT